jgi:hypothetical protein
MMAAELLSLLAATNTINLFSARNSGIRASFEVSAQGVRARRSRLIWFVIAGSVLASGSVSTLLGWLAFRWSLSLIAASIGSAIILSAFLAIFGHVVYRSALAAFTPQASLDAEKQVAEEEERLMRDTTLPALLRYNRDQMALYHRIATAQARVAGRSSQSAMAIGFAALIAGSVVAIVSGDITTKVITGGLAALGGVFSGYIARTFLVAQDKAIGQLYKYWEQPLTTSYILAAERIAASFGDNRKEKELGKLIDQLLMIAIQREAPSAESRNGTLPTRTQSNRTKSGQRAVDEEPTHSAGV